MVKRIFLISHAQRFLGSGLTSDHRLYAKATGARIMSAMDPSEKVAIWTSLSTEAIQTAEIVNHEVSAIEVVICHELGFDATDFDESPSWISRRLNSDSCDTIVMVCHVSLFAIFRPTLKSGGYQTEEIRLDDDEFM